MSSNGVSFNKPFSHVYVEEKVKDHPVTLKILERLPDAVVIYITHYKDVFNRSRQNVTLQKKATSLILAENTGELVFKGSPMCQSFGEKNFYYTASSMNCPFDCEYCFLKGMYSTSNVVCFVNFEDYAKAVEALEDPYVCVSYDTDLLGLNSITGHADMWVQFAKEHPDVLIEMRTKAAPSDLTPLPNLIYAFTLSPEEIAKRFEPGVPSLDARLSSVAKAIESGCVVRLCFDPMIYVEGWEKYYSELMRKVLSAIDITKVRDVSCGTFRIASEYLKIMRRQMPDSEICWFPYENRDGYAKYPDELDQRMQKVIWDSLENISGS